MTGRVLTEEELEEAEFVQLPIVHNLIATIRDLQSRYNEALKVIDSLGGRNSNGEA